MFGYVRPLKDALSEADRGRYQAVYCGLCHTLKARYGRIATLFLNYDFAFLAMVLAGETETSALACRRCVTYPTRKQDTWQQNPALDLAADESVILSYWKLKDGIADHRFFGKLPHALGAAGLYRAYRKAQRRCPEFDEAVRRCLGELRDLEQAGCQSLDPPADAFARLLQAAGDAGEKPGTHALGQMLYHIGRWIYLVDAWDDLEEDRKSGSYNPILAQFGPRALEEQARVRETLYASLGMAGGAAAWLALGTWFDIVNNIITLGLPAVEEAVLSGEWKQQNKRKENNG